MSYAYRYQFGVNMLQFYKVEMVYYGTIIFREIFSKTISIVPINELIFGNIRNQSIGIVYEEK